MSSQHCQIWQRLTDLSGHRHIRQQHELFYETVWEITCIGDCGIVRLCAWEILYMGNCDIVCMEDCKICIYTVHGINIWETEMEDHIVTEIVCIGDCRL